jgi:hypothetical protein
MSDGGFDEFGDAGKLIWACTCGKGGVAFQRGTERARVDLERKVSEHLRQRGNESHRVDVGRYVTSTRLDRQPPPLVWGEDES